LLLFIEIAFFLLNVFIIYLFISRKIHLCFLGNLGDIFVQFLSYGVSVGINRVPSSSLKIPPFVYFYRHKPVVIYVLISRKICGILGFHSMKKCRMNEKCKAKPTEGESTSQYKKQYHM
jgi:hypothetical protein